MAKGPTQSGGQDTPRPPRRRSRKSPATGADAVPAQVEPSTDKAANRGASGARLPAPGLAPTDEDIRLRAYHRYLERGGGHGQAFDDWLEAERELRSQTS